MNEAEVIRQGKIKKLKLSLMQAQTDAKAALRFLVKTATKAIGTLVEEINTAELTAHLEQLVSKQEEAKRIEEEINELER